MRRILAAIGVVLTVGGLTALTPLLAAIGGGVTLTLVSVGVAIWRWIRKRGARTAHSNEALAGVR